MHQHGHCKTLPWTEAWHRSSSSLVSVLPSRLSSFTGLPNRLREVVGVEADAFCERPRILSRLAPNEPNASITNTLPGLGNGFEIAANAAAASCRTPWSAFVKHSRSAGIRSARDDAQFSPRAITRCDISINNTWSWWRVKRSPPPSISEIISRKRVC